MRGLYSGVGFIWVGIAEWVLAFNPWTKQGTKPELAQLVEHSPVVVLN